jgi:hypothetical protein
MAMASVDGSSWRLENEDYQKQSMAHRFRSDEKFVQVVCGQDHRFLFIIYLTISTLRWLLIFYLFLLFQYAHK